MSERARQIAESWAETEFEPRVSDRDDDVVLARAYLDLASENERLRLERDDFEQRLHAYKQGEI